MVHAIKIFFQRPIIKINLRMGLYSKLKGRFHGHRTVFKSLKRSSSAFKDYFLSSLFVNFNLSGVINFLSIRPLEAFEVFFFFCVFVLGHFKEEMVSFEGFSVFLARHLVMSGKEENSKQGGPPLNSGFIKAPI